MHADNRKVIESKANEKEWRNECERVKKYLENVTSVDQKEWRHHIERSKDLSEKIQADVSQILPRNLSCKEASKNLLTFWRNI